jgi:hypothetical protein
MIVQWVMLEQGVRLWLPPVLPHLERGKEIWLVIRGSVLFINPIELIYIQKIYCRCPKSNNFRRVGLRAYM